MTGFSTYPALLFLHLAAVVVWVGGMAIMQFAVRPSAMLLEPPQRLAFMTATLGRFFVMVIIAICVALVTGAWMLRFLSLAGHVPRSVHAMTGLGVLMAAIFAYIRLAFFPRLEQALAAGALPEAAAALAVIRRLVEVNLVLGFVTLGFGVAARLVLL
jgi:uncharacterized membrane protein